MPQPFDFAKGYVLTDEDVKVLRPLIEKHQRDRGNELLFRYGYEEPYWLDEGPPSQRSGTYIALVPVGGIAALTNPAGTGDDNIAGMAVCSIYQIAIDVTGTIATVVDTGLMERVYNLGQTPVKTRYVIVHLDRYGRWVTGVENIASLSASFDIVSSEPTLNLTTGTTIPFDIADANCTNNSGIALTATAGEIQVPLSGKIRVYSQVIGLNIIDANIYKWEIWLQKYTSAWAHVPDTVTPGYTDGGTSDGASLQFFRHLDVAAGNKIRVRGLQLNGTDNGVRIVSQRQPSIDVDGAGSAALHFGSKLIVEYVELHA